MVMDILYGYFLDHSSGRCDMFIKMFGNHIWKNQIFSETSISYVRHLGLIEINRYSLLYLRGGYFSILVLSENPHSGIHSTYKVIVDVFSTVESSSKLCMVCENVSLFKT